MSAKSLIKMLVSDRSYYNKYYNIIKSHSFLKECDIIYDNIDHIYKSSTKDKIEEDDLILYISMREGSKLSSDKLTTVTTLAKGAYKAGEVDESLVKLLVERYYAELITNVSAKVMEGKEKVLKITELTHEMNHELGKFDAEEEAKYEHTDDVESTLEELHSKEGGLNWRLPQLNEVFGKLGNGEFFIVGARPDGGKTTFLTSECSYFATQSKRDKPILWFCNEESHQRIKSRFIQSALGVTNAKIREDKAEIINNYMSMYDEIDPIVIYRKPEITLKEVEDMVVKYNPEIVVFDQLYKMELGKTTKDMETERYRKIAQFARDIATECGTVFGTAWLDSSAENNMYPNQSSIYMSKTGVQGEADAILTIGSSNEPEHKDKRFFNVPKNKLIGAAEEYRNAKFEVTLEREIGRYK